MPSRHSKSKTPTPIQLLRGLKAQFDVVVNPEGRLATYIFTQNIPIWGDSLERPFIGSYPIRHWYEAQKEGDKYRIFKLKDVRSPRNHSEPSGTSKKEVFSSNQGKLYSLEDSIGILIEREKELGKYNKSRYQELECIHYSRFVRGNPGVYILSKNQELTLGAQARIEQVP